MNFTYAIDGKNYSVPSKLFLDALSAINEDEACFTVDCLRYQAAQNLFFQTINAKLNFDGSRQYSHSLTVGDEVVWMDDWKSGQSGGFDLLDFENALRKHLCELDLLEED
jgi:hypothetical protein